MTADDTTPARVAAAAEALAAALPVALGWEWDEEPPNVPSVAHVVADIAAELAPAVVAALDAQPGDAEQAGGCAYRFPDGTFCRLTPAAHDMPGMGHHARAARAAGPAGDTAERALDEVRKERDAALTLLLSVSDALTKWNGEDGSLVIDAVARNARKFVREVRAAADTGHQGGDT